MKKLLEFIRTAAKAPKSDTSSGFAQLGLNDALCLAVSQEGYETPTPIQQQAIPIILQGKDLLGCAQTGTGKTAGFALPMLQRLSMQANPVAAIRALVLTPTRELAIQVENSFKVYGKHLNLRSAVIFGGVGYEPQKQAIRSRPAILVATPGRLLDLMNQHLVDLSKLEIFVLDEADRMLDMGFIHDVRRVITALPKQRQNLLFSATMPRDIQDLADKILVQPTKVEVTPVSSTSDRISQQVYFVEKQDKRALLLHVLRAEHAGRTIVFTRTKSGANRVAEFLNKSGITAEAIHGNKSQSARQRALENFRTGSTQVLVASDIASRGIDVDGITHVINFEIPNVAETYVHRIGRTGRAEATGRAISFCQADERPFLAGIEKLTRSRIPVVSQHPYVSATPIFAQPENSSPEGRNPHRGRSRNRRRRGSQSGGGSGGQPRQASPNRDAGSSGRSHESRPQSRSRGGGASGGKPRQSNRQDPH